MPSSSTPTPLRPQTPRSRWPRGSQKPQPADISLLVLAPLLLLHELVEKLVHEEPPLRRDLDRLRRPDVPPPLEPIPEDQPPDDVGPLVDLYAVAVVRVRGQVVQAQGARGRGLDEDLEEAWGACFVGWGKRERSGAECSGDGR